MKKGYIVTGWLTRVVIGLVVFGLIFTLVGMLPTTIVSAEVTYSNALSDLQKDSSFNVEDFVYNSADYSLQVIQIAESSAKELFVYVYQPSGQQGGIQASSINISTEIEGLSFTNYKLELLNSKGVFYKYIVKDFTVSSDSKRFYVITSIFRPFDGRIDDGAEGGNSVSEVSFSVGKQYCITDEGVTCVDVETITVTDKFVGYVRYPAGFAFFAQGACDSHFVAFCTDKPIDKLYEADIYYVRQSWSRAENTGITTSEGFYDLAEEYVTMTYKDKVSYTGPGIGAATFVWDRIESVEDFIGNVEMTNVYSGALINVSYGMHLTNEAKAELENKQWVLRFAETPYLYEHYSSGTWMYQERVEQTFVGDVSILRLKFETDGKVYNLGTIDNKQTGSEDPSNLSPEIEVSVATEKPYFWTIIAAFLLLVLIFVLWPVMPYIVRFLIWLILLPFHIVKFIIDACNSDSAKMRRMNRKIRREERKLERKKKHVDANKVKNDLRTGKRKWADLSEEEEVVLLQDTEYVNSLFDNDNWNGEE